MLCKCGTEVSPEVIIGIGFGFGASTCLAQEWNGVMEDGRCWKCLEEIKDD